MAGRKILVVDDEESIRDILKMALTDAGYEVLTAPDATIAADILRGESIMVMFLDLNLPGITGVELCRRIRLKNPVCIIYAMTGYTDLFGLLECRKAGFDDFFSKPVSIHVLREAAGEAFKKIERWGITGHGLD
ncbi:MAG: response regulator [Desulfobacteraceae bacterium]|nr:MAG: response regulator [Desulfobacteraceae bacterium]